jgi:hypothetical protein
LTLRHSIPSLPGVFTCFVWSSVSTVASLSSTNWLELVVDVFNVRQEISFIRLWFSLTSCFIG